MKPITFLDWRKQRMRDINNSITVIEAIEGIEDIKEEEVVVGLQEAIDNKATMSLLMRAKRKQKRMKIGITTVKGKISPKSSKKC
jgi:hypothetical protein